VLVKKEFDSRVVAGRLARIFEKAMKKYKK